MTKFDFDIILYGGPGAGKGTQATLLAEKIAGMHLSMGAQLRAIAAEDTDMAASIRETINEGHLVPDSISAAIVEQFVGRADGQNIIFDGYPRSVEQAKDLDEILERHHRVAKLVFIDLPLEIAQDRIVKRAHLEHRLDDQDPAAVAERIEIFHHNASSILDHYQSDNRLVTVDGNGEVDEVATRLFQMLNHATDR